MNPPTGSSASDAPPAVADRASALPSTLLDIENLVPGARWREVYQIGEQLSDVTYGKVFKALHVGVMNDVIIRSFRVSDDSRACTWEGIQSAKNSGLLELIEAVEADGRRIEVTQSAPTLTLREWAGRRKASQGEIELIARQLSQALGSLHKQGVVHLNVRSDMIFVRATEGGLNVVLGGFETATSLRVEGFVELSVDPFYAPPEALGLFHYTREPGLRAWDWWSLGRVMQEVVLGRHILGHILERDVTRETPELRTRAENILKEQDASMRAGAVEMMPAMDRELATMLRGLLTGSRDGRWGLAEIESWLRKEPVKDRYSLPRNERLFIWKDRAYTVPEAAVYFSSAAHWQEGMKNIYEPTNPATLAHFLETEGAHKKTKERFDLLLKLSEAPALQQLPAEIVSNVVMAVVLKFMAGHDASLLLRGHRIDETCLRQLLRPEAQPGGLNTVYGFTANPVVQQILQFDAEAGRMLGELNRVFEAAVALALLNKWLSIDDGVGMATLMDLCLEPEAGLGKKHAEMLKLYACSRDRVLDKLFNKRDANHAELVVIAFTLREPGKFGYVTHSEWNAAQYRLLSERAEQLAAAGLWLKLGHALKLGPLIFGRWRFFLLVWGLLALVMAFVGQNLFAYLLAAACFVAVLVVRVMWFGFHRAKLQHRLHDGSPWTLRSGWPRCRAEALAILKADSLPGPGEVMKLLDQANADIVKLVLDPAPKQISPPPSFKDTQIVALVSWVLVLALSVGTVLYGVRHPPKMPPVKWSWITHLWSSSEQASGVATDDKSKSKLSTEQVPTAGVKSIQNTLDELRRAKLEASKKDEPVVKISWPFKTPKEARSMRIQESPVALPEQLAVAEEMAQLLTDHYDPKTINAIIAVQVPVEKGVGLMLYDGRTGKITDKKVYTVGFVPFTKSWLEIDSKMVIYIGGL